MFISLICPVCIKCCKEKKTWRDTQVEKQDSCETFSLSTLTDVPQKIHFGHCHAGPCQRSTEGAPRSFSSSSLINTLLIGCWEDSSDDWLLWHSLPLSDFVEPYWNQSEAVQIALFLMTPTEGSSTCDDMSSAKHNPPSSIHAPFFLLSAANIKSRCQH